MKKTFLFIFFAALAFTVHGAPLVPTESYSDDYNPYDSGDSTVVCSQMDEVATAEKPCCQGLESGHGGKCFEPTLVDPGLTSCTSSASCPTGTACMPMSREDLFSRSSPSFGREEFEDLRSILTMQLADDDELKKIGESCSHAKECPSYSCVAGKCVEKKVCRFARYKESPAFGQRCGEGYVLVNGICDQDPKSKYPVVNNFTDSFEYTQVGNKCSSFKMDESKQQDGINAIKHTRALEWLIMSHTVDPYNDCYDLSLALRDNMMKAFQEGRKQATEKLAKNLAEIEKDTFSLTHAKEIGDKTIIIHGVESITGKELDTRLASGRDAMFLLMRRNSFFIEYEQEMFALAEELSGRFVKMQEALSNWQNGDESWDLGVRKSGFKECSARYKVWKPIKWRWKDYKDTANRWGFAYTLNPNKSDVKDILYKKSILDTLTKILNKTESEVKSQVYLPATQPFGINRTFLVDPLMHGGTYAKNYGSHTSDGHRGFLGLGRRDRHPYANNPNLSKMYSDRKENFVTYLKNFRPNETVNYEYELMPYMDQDCLSKGEACKTFLEHKDKFGKYVEDVMDISMAQFLAFSLRNRKDNADYFNDAYSGRSRFLLSAIGSFSTLQSYYLGSIEMQAKQNECLSKVINGIDESGINQPGGGIKEGEYYDPNLANPGTVGNGTKPTTIKPPKGNQIAAGNIGGGFPKSLLSGGTSSLGNTGGNGKGAGNNFGQGNSSLSDQTLASFSKRKTDINDKNKTATSKGVKINGPKKEYAETMDSMQKGDALAGSGRGGNASFNGGSGASGGLSNSAFGRGNGSGAGTSEGDETNTNEISGVGTSEGEIPAGSQGIGINTASGLGQNYGNGSGSSEGDNASSLTDQTGMSDEEKNQMLAVYERTKHRYDSDGEDGIFEKVSKAYVRNLEKILVRKKSID